MSYTALFQKLDQEIAKYFALFTFLFDKFQFANGGGGVSPFKTSSVFLTLNNVLKLEQEL